MKIAIPHADGQIFPHFGKTPQFLVAEVENQKILSTTMLTPSTGGHGALAAFLREQQVDTVICGGIGESAQLALAQAGIQLFGGVRGNALEALQDFLQGTLQWNPLLLLQGGGCKHHCGGNCSAEHCE